MTHPPTLLPFSAPILFCPNCAQNRTFTYHRGRFEPSYYECPVCTFKILRSQKTDQMLIE